MAMENMSVGLADKLVAPKSEMKKPSPLSAEMVARNVEARKDREGLERLKQTDPAAHAEELTRRQANFDKVKEAQTVLGVLSEARPLDSRQLIGRSMEMSDAVEMLSMQNPSRRKKLGGEGDAGGVNVTERWKFGDPDGQDPTMVAYAKSAMGEEGYRFIPSLDEPGNLDAGRYVKVKKTMKDGQLVEAFEDVTDEADMVEGMKMWKENAKNYEVAFKATYGENAKVPFNENERTKKLGFSAGKGAVREVGAYAASELMGFNQVPPTALRTSETGADLLSVQRNVDVTDREHPPQDLSTENLSLLLQAEELVDDAGLEVLQRDVAHAEEKLKRALVRGADAQEAQALQDAFDAASKNLFVQNMARSMADAATFQHILGVFDAHPGNLYVDPVSGKVTIIDNGYSFGLSFKQEQPQPNGTSKTVLRPYEAIVSVPLEIMEQHPKWKTPESTVRRLRGLMQETVTYLQFREDKAAWREKNPGQKDPEGKFSKAFTKVLRMVHGDDHVAAVEGTQMLKRMQEVIENGRPPMSQDPSAMIRYLPFLEEELNALKATKPEKPSQEIRDATEAELEDVFKGFG